MASWFIAVSILALIQLSLCYGFAGVQLNLSCRNMALNGARGGGAGGGGGGGDGIGRDRSNYFVRGIRGIARTGMKDYDNLRVGDMVVARCEIPKSRIWSGSGYEITEMYAQGVNVDSGVTEKLALDTLGSFKGQVGYTVFLKVFNPQCHKETGPVIVTADEIGLCTLRTELNASLLLALPGFFWVFVAWKFASYYNHVYGGNFLDALLGT